MESFSSACLQKQEETTSPSTRRGAPLMAEATGLQTKVTNRATSSGVSKRLSNELGRMLLKNSFSRVSKDWPPPNCATKSSKPSEWVGPRRIQFAVTPVPPQDSAKPREIASCAVLVMP